MEYREAIQKVLADSEALDLKAELGNIETEEKAFYDRAAVEIGQQIVESGYIPLNARVILTSKEMDALAHPGTHTLNNVDGLKTALAERLPDVKCYAMYGGSVSGDELVIRVERKRD